ncbi:acyl carrier protein [Streptomyces sp. NPDC012950]|uniref:acyl carrier protein n=1 Tax=Streptomyces sp. NPDC012950 TaxID=3364858 RepID=UPI0036AECEFE
MLLADVAHLDDVPPDNYFFDELGTDSLVMAHFCARVRKQDGLPDVSMRDVYRHPTIRSLSTALEGDRPAPAPAPPPSPKRSDVSGSAR